MTKVECVSAIKRLQERPKDIAADVNTPALHLVLAYLNDKAPEIVDEVIKLQLSRVFKAKRG